MPILFRFILCFLPLAGLSQQVKQYSFKHFTTLNGLASNMVYNVIQDKDGYMWVATTNGMQRYDGSTFTSFRSDLNNTQSVPSDVISLFFQDRQKNLWLVGDNNRFGTWDTRKFKFREALLRSRDSSGVRLLFEMPSGALMMFQESGSINRYDPATHEFHPDNLSLPVPINWKINTISFDATINKFWFSCDSGLLLVDPVTKHMNYRDHNPDNDPVIRMCSGIRNPLGAITNGKGVVVFMTWITHEGFPTFYWCDPKKTRPETYNFVNQIGYHEPKGALVQSNGRFWVHGYAYFAEWTNGGPKLNLVPNEFRNEQSLKFDYAYYSFEDRENNIWICTDNGLYLFNPDEQVFNTYYLARPNGKSSNEGVVQAVEETKDHKVLIGCWGTGMYAFDRDMNPVDLPGALRKKGLYYSVWDMSTNYKNGDIWIAQQGGLLAVYNQAKDQLVEVNHEIFGGSTIRQVDEDTSGNMWFGTQSGRIIKWDIKKAGNDPRKGFELITTTGMVHKIHYDYQGYVYVATFGKGLLKINAKTNKVVYQFTTSGPEGKRLFMNYPSDMTYYNDTTLVVTAGCVNVINTKTHAVRFFSYEDGLPSNNCQSVQKDHKGILWIGMLNGICRLNLEKKVLSFYDRRDGIVQDKFSMTGIKHLSDQRMIFYTDHNFLVFDTEKFGQQNLPPKPFITGFKLGGKSLSLDSVLSEERAVLRYNNTSIGIHFSALTFKQQRKVHYFYKLENLDEDWIHTDQPNEVVYNFLPPGEYVFRVKSENADGLMSTETASLPIVVRAPLWKTWWFYSLVALLAIAILYLLDRERMNKLRSLQQVRTQIRQNLREEVSTTLNNINVLSEIAKIKADKSIEQSKDFIDQISDKSRYMMEAMDDVLWSIDPQNDSMRKTLLRLKEVTEGMSASTGVSIDLIVDHKVQVMELNMKLRYELFFFYKEAVQFIVSNISSPQVFVNFNRLKSKLLIEILCECDEPAEGFKQKFRDAMAKRLSALPATMDVVADNNSFAVILVVNVV